MLLPNTKSSQFEKVCVSTNGGISVMYKKSLVGITATITAISMVAAPCLTAYAEDVTGYQNITSDTKIEGNVTSDSSDNSLIDKGLVEASGAGTEVEITGNVDGSAIVQGEEESISSRHTWSYTWPDKVVYSITDEDTLTRTGGAKAGVSVSGGASVSVGGDVIGGDNGAIVNGNSSLTVGRDVVSNGQEKIYSGHKYTGSDIIRYTGTEDIKPGTNNDELGYAVKADAVADENNVFGYSNHADGTGISTDGDGNIIVKGDVKSTGNGIVIDTNTNGDKGSITVLGTIKGDEYGINIADAYYMMEYYENHPQLGGTLDADGTYMDYHERCIAAGESEESFQARTKAAGEKLAAEVPEITVYAIESKRTINNSRDNDYFEAYQIAYDKIVNAINYIIRHDDNITITADTKTIDADEYFVTKINQAFEVAADVPSGYRLTGGENVKVTDKGNGRYELILTDISGKINVRAELIPVTKKEETSYEVVVEEVPQAEPAPAPVQHIAPTSTATLAAVSNLTSQAETQAFIEKVSGDKPAQTVAFEVKKVSTEQYKTAVIESIATAPAGGAFNLVTDQPSLFDTKMVDAMMERNDVDVNVVFGYGGKTYKVVIPAGYNIRSLLDSNGFCGFLKLLAVLGGTTI